MNRTVSTGFCILVSVICLLGTGCAQIERFGTLTRRTFETFDSKLALRAARQMEDERFPDERRKGINKLVERDFGQRDPYTKRYAQIARLDPDYLVRVTAIRALNRSRYQPATPVFIEALTKDDHAKVRLEAAKALGNVPDPAATGPLIATVNKVGEDLDVRTAAADALRHYKQLDVARALAEQLGGKGDFSVAWQARRSLESITGRDLRYDQKAWLAYINGPEKPFG
jgi:hypothetical protein